MGVEIHPTERKREEAIRSIACPRCGAQPKRACKEPGAKGFRHTVPMSHYGRKLAWEAQR